MANKSIELAFTVLEVLIAVACCVGNLLVIWAVWTCGAMRRKPTFCLIVSLAVADFLVGAVVVPLAVLVDGRVRTSFYGCLLPSCIQIVITQASVQSLLAIAVDRFLRVYIPHRYRAVVTQKLIWIMVGTCWSSSGVLGFIPMFGWYRQDTLAEMEESNSTTITCTFLGVIPMNYMVNFNFFVCLLPPLVLMVVLYLCIFVKIHQQLRGSGASGSDSQNYYQKERQLAHSLLLVLVLFGVSWLPLHFMNVAALYSPQLTVPHQVFYVGILLAQANSAVNPIIYALKVQKIREAMRSLWRRVFLCNVERKAQGSSQTRVKQSSSNQNNLNETIESKSAIKTQSLTDSGNFGENIHQL
ncbi:adenosine receptor A1-like [Engraulis encrasicolus]|uniref:adenosine receptor A1-like n=1 Tax=Engraulis encrasicolus TaxID=184585 RepID=UPI002FD30E98